MSCLTKIIKWEDIKIKEEKRKSAEDIKSEVKEWNEKYRQMLEDIFVPIQKSIEEDTKELGGKSLSPTYHFSRVITSKKYTDIDDVILSLEKINTILEEYKSCLEKCDVNHLLSIHLTIDGIRLVIDICKTAKSTKDPETEPDLNNN